MCIYTHALTHRHTLSLEHRLLCAPGAVALEGYSKGSILKGCCHGDNYGAHLPWASKLYTTFLPAEHGLSHTVYPPPMHKHTRSFLLFSALYGKAGREPIFDLNRARQ